MIQTFRYFFLIGILTLISAPSFARLNPRIEDGLAITQPRIVETLSQRASGVDAGRGVGIGYYLDPSGQSTPVISNRELSKLPAFQPILASIQSEIEKFTAENNRPGHRVGIGVGFESRLFDTHFLTDDRTRFALVGVINRLDKAFQDPSTCGEVRLIYRLAYRVQINGDKDKDVTSRLPMTINLILHAKSPHSPLTCQEIALRWKTLDYEGLTVTQAADIIMGNFGPLAPELRDRSLIKQLEINLQMAREPAGVRRDFGGNAVYLLKVYKWNEQKQNFQEVSVDNQVDRTKAKSFFNWLFEPQAKRDRLRALDQGTIEIPDEFLAKSAYSTAPGALSRAINHPLFGILPDSEIAKQLKDVAPSDLINIKSVEGFKRRLTDVSCTGCHQTRAIGGFHFMGQDPYRFVEVIAKNMATEQIASVYPGNAVVVPGSGHFFADLERRHYVLEDFFAGRQPNFAIGFSSRPQEHVATQAIEGLGTYNGWGAHCYLGNDPSFSQWTCAKGMRCEQLHVTSVAPGMGVCISQGGQQLGDPTETGRVTLLDTNNFTDKYERLKRFPMPPGNQYVNSPQSAVGNEKTGGFPGGSIRLTSCNPSDMKQHPESRCGGLPAASNGFNDCLFQPNVSYKQCIDKYTKGVGLRGCSRENPCRDDYICVESMDPNLEDAGVCVPPYFLFQFRVDGHPIKF